MNDEQTSKKGKKTGGVRIETSTPTGHEEIGANWASQQAHSDTPPDKLQKKKETRERPLQPEQPLNPKRNKSQPL